MTHLTGFMSQINFASVAGYLAKIDLLLAAIPDPDSTSTSGAQQGILGYLDEMGPMAAANLRVELNALKANIGGSTTPASQVDSASGTYTVVAADDTAGLFDIVTGLADLTLTKCAVTIRRAGTELLTARTLSEPVPGTIRVTDSTYTATAGDLVVWFAQK